MIRKLKKMPYANATIIENDSTNINLISYVTTVIEIKDGWLQVNGLYSMTTRRHISNFMREFGFSYQLAKQLYEDKMALNIFTGEVKNLA